MDKLSITTHAGRFQAILESDTEVIVEYIEQAQAEDRPLFETLDALLALAED